MWEDTRNSTIKTWLSDSDRAALVAEVSIAVIECRKAYEEAGE
jgi:hypothetical protein